LARISLRWSTPILTALLVALLATACWTVSRREEMAQLHEERRLLVDARMGLLQQALARALESGDPSAVQHELDARREPDQALVAVFDARGESLAPPSRPDLAAGWDALRADAEPRLGLALDRFRRAALGGERVVGLSRDGRRIFGLAPVAPAALRPAFVYLESDLTPQLERIDARALRYTALATAAASFAAAIVILMLELGVFRPAARLAAAATRVAAGDRAQELPLGGERDVAALAAALQRMLGDLRSGERRLNERELLLRTIVDSVPSGIHLVDDQGRVYFANRVTTERIGRTAEEVVGHTLEELIAPAEREAILARVREAFEHGGTTLSRAEFPLEDGMHQYLVQRTVREGENGRRLLLTVSTDVTEPAKLEAQLREAQKLEAVGRVAAGILHDVNNFLTIALGNAGWLVEQLGSGEPRDRAQEILATTRRTAALTRRLLAFTRAAPTVARVEDLGALTRDFERLMRSLVGEGIELRIEIAPGRWLARIPSESFEQMLLNLALNARDAMPQGGWLTLRLGAAESDPAHPEQRWLAVEVSDTGTGMAPEVQAHALDPFFTTKPVGLGTGLGLSVCANIVRAARGRMEIQSEPDHGTTVRVFLPLADEEAAAPARAAAQAAPRGGSETLLVVDDEPLLLALAVRTLQALGYRTLTAASASEALRVARAHRGPIALLVSDLVMPGGGGVDLARQLLRERAALRFLFTSGHAENLADKLAASGLAYTLLEKPFTPDELGLAVRSALERA
jgi:PAS domain S-box-containing protein